MKRTSWAILLALIRENCWECFVPVGKDVAAVVLVVMVLKVVMEWVGQSAGVLKPVNYGGYLKTIGGLGVGVREA